ncbi:DNA repair exonuclease MRE11, partial [Pseudoloma neurophilia]
MRILITSDNHLGYKETDPLLSLDSFRAFEEILQNSNDCDFMINAGDLFHSNKPSRFTMYKTIRLLRENIISNEKNSRCMIDGIPLDKYDFEDCRYNKSQAVDKNSQTDDKNPKTGDKNSKTGDKNSETGDKNSETGDKNSKTGGKNPKTGDKNPQVNMKKSTGQNQLKNLKLPILVINGNHDDPCGFGSLSALDVLHETRLVNYVGRNENIDNIVIKPIIITEECGNNRLNVAIYFLSHVRDTRLFRLFAQNRVYFEESDCDISILVVHQNRIERTGNDNLSMDLIPEFFNLIIFGHEHDPLIMERRYQTILQCGSTVRTSCCDGEVGNKYYYKLDITLKDDLRKSKFSGNFNEKLRKGQN